MSPDGTYDDNDLIPLIPGGISGRKSTLATSVGRPGANCSTQLTSLFGANMDAIMDRGVVRNGFDEPQPRQKERTTCKAVAVLEVLLRPCTT